MSKHYPPTYLQKQFHCPHCAVYAAQSWRQFYFDSGRPGYNIHQKLRYCVCGHCGEWSYWYNERMLVPSEAPVPPPHEDLPELCRADYEEAREIVAISPRGAAALLRLTLQNLMVALGEKGRNLNDDIGSLVEKGLPVLVQQALDYCRVVGNNAVHPGELQVSDTPEIAHNLFAMINFIVEDRISRPKQIQQLYSQLPPGALQAIEKRDEGKA